LSEIKTATDAPAPAAEKIDLSGLESDLKILIGHSDSNTEILSEIKKSSSGPEILAAIGAQGAVLADLKNAQLSPQVLAAVESLKGDVSATKTGVNETHDALKVLVDALPKLENDEVLAKVEAVKSAVEGIQIPKVDNTEVISQVKAVHTLVSERKDTEILAEVKEIKVLVEKNATVAKVEEVGENDKGVEVDKAAEKGSNGVKTAVEA
jgi:hypothetical protein